MIENKTLIKIGVLFVIIILILFFISIINNYNMYKGNIPQIANLEDANAICQNNSTGWQCDFEGIDAEMDVMPSRPLRNYETTAEEIEVENKLRLNYTLQKNFYNNYKTTCEQQGGKWNYSIFCNADCRYYCDFKYTDADQPCISGFQCGSGVCEGLIGIGKCTQHQIRTHNFPYRILFIIPDPINLIDSVLIYN